MQNSPSAASPEPLAFACEDPFLTQYPDAIRAWQHHAISCFPDEACGFITKAGGFIPARNIHKDPRNFFEVDPEDIPDEADIAGFVHSHTPEEPNEEGYAPPIIIEPSKSDMEAQLAWGFPFGISGCDGETTTEPLWWGDTLPIRPLVGRVFVHGIWDCYSLVRDWHRTEHGIIIPEYPRENRWWGENGENMYTMFFEQAGFNRVYRDSPLPGDCFICKLHSDVLNHAGVYVGDGLILHHPGNNLSLHSAAARWHSKMDFLVRHKDLPEPDET